MSSQLRKVPDAFRGPAEPFSNLPAGVTGAFVTEDQARQWWRDSPDAQAGMTAEESLRAHVAWQEERLASYDYPEMGTVLHDRPDPGKLDQVIGMRRTAAFEQDSLEDVARAGYNTDGWGKWQQGKCGTYACALMRLHPGLRFGTAGYTENGGGDASGGWNPAHHFAHDDHYAYDSAGRHPLPYRGIHGDMDYHELNGDPEDWGIRHEEAGPEGFEHHIAEAMNHARQHGILEGRHELRHTAVYEHEDPRDDDPNGGAADVGIYWESPAQQGWVDENLGEPQEVPAPEPMMTEAAWYHGSPHELEDGALIELGHPSNYGGQPSTHVFFTADPAGARQWAEDAMEMPQPPGLSAHHYEVEPTGDYEPDPKGEGPGDHRSVHPLQVVRRLSTTINGQTIDGHGDAPGHGTEPRAAEPNDYDGRSTEGDGDPKWSEPVSVPGKTDDQVKRENNGGMVGMYPEGMSAGDGPALEIGAFVAGLSLTPRWVPHVDPGMAGHIHEVHRVPPEMARAEMERAGVDGEDYHSLLHVADEMYGVQWRSGAVPHSHTAGRVPWTDAERGELHDFDTGQSTTWGDFVPSGDFTGRHPGPPYGPDSEELMREQLLQAAASADEESTADRMRRALGDYNDAAEHDRRHEEELASRFGRPPMLPYHSPELGGSVRGDPESAVTDSMPAAPKHPDDMNEAELARFYSAKGPRAYPAAVAGTPDKNTLTQPGQPQRGHLDDLADALVRSIFQRQPQPHGLDDSLDDPQPVDGGPGDPDNSLDAGEDIPEDKNGLDTASEQASAPVPQDKQADSPGAMPPAAQPMHDPSHSVTPQAPGPDMATGQDPEHPPFAWPLKAPAPAPVQKLPPWTQGTNPLPGQVQPKTGPGFNPQLLVMPGQALAGESEGDTETSQGDSETSEAPAGASKPSKPGKPGKKAALAAFVAAASSPAFRFEFTAAWRDVVAKATRIRTAGGVRITRASAGMVIGEVRGDHDVYESGIQRAPGHPQSIQHFACGCPWGTFRQDGSLPGRLNGRPCSHAYAVHLEAMSRTAHGRDLGIDPPVSELKPYLRYDVVVKSEPPWGPGGWRRTWLAPAASLHAATPDEARDWNWSPEERDLWEQEAQVAASDFDDPDDGRGMCAYAHEGPCPPMGHEAESIRHSRPRDFQSKITLNPGHNLDGHAPQQWASHVLTGYVNGKIAGHLHFSQSDDGRAIEVQMLHTRGGVPRGGEHRGVGSAMMDDLYSHAHANDAWIDHGRRTEDGGNWWASYREPHPELNAHHAPPEAGWEKYWSPYRVAVEAAQNYADNPRGAHTPITWNPTHYSAREPDEEWTHARGGQRAPVHAALAALAGEDPADVAGLCLAAGITASVAELPSLRQHMEEEHGPESVTGWKGDPSFTAADIHDWQHSHFMRMPVPHEHPEPGEPRPLRVVQADQANSPWGSQNVTADPPLNPYGATEPRDPEANPGSSGFLTSPDPDNWGQIDTGNPLQMPLSNAASKVLAPGAATPVPDSLNWPDTGDWHKGSVFTGVPAGSSQEDAPVDPQGIRMEEVLAGAWARPRPDGAEGCGCCDDTGEHPTGHECYRCDASGYVEGSEKDSPPCDLVFRDRYLHALGCPHCGPSPLGSTEQERETGRQLYPGKTHTADHFVAPDESDEDVRQRLGIDGTMGDAQDVPHEFQDGGMRGCEACGLASGAKVHHTPEPALPVTTAEDLGGEDLTPDDVSIQTVGQQQWSGGGSDSGEVTAGPGQPQGGLDDDIIASFQRSAAARKYSGDNPGATMGDGDIAAAAQAFLKTGQVLPPEEAAALISEGRGSRARNLDLLDIEGTHYAELGDEAGDAAEDGLVWA